MKAWRIAVCRWLLFGLLLVGNGTAAPAKVTTTRLGPVDVHVELSPDAPQIGDEVVLEIRVVAAGEVEVLMPEFGEALDQYAILDFVPKQTIEPDGRSTFLQRYTLQPKRSGPQSIPPILVEFVDNRVGQKKSPDDYDAYEILTDRLDFEVASVLPDDAADELKPPLGELAPPAEASSARFVVFLLLVLGGVALVVVLGFATRRHRQQRRKKSAYEIAMAWLARELAKPTPQTDAEVDAYFVALSRIVRTYLENRFDLRAPDLTTEEFLELAGTSRDLSREHQHLLRDFLRQADLVKFAGVKASAEDIQQAGELARRFLEETRENAPVLEVDEDTLPAEREVVGRV